MKRALTRIIGIGQPAAGDDGVGIAVARALREIDLPVGAEIYETTDPGWLIELLDSARRAILIDAVVCGNEPGDIVCLAPEELASCPVTPLSSHGMSIADAIGLVHTLEPATLRTNIRIIGITIMQPSRYTCGMSPPVEAAVPHVVSLVLNLLEVKKTLTCV